MSKIDLDPGVAVIANDREALERTLLALRKAARERDSNGRRNFAHLPQYRAAFVRGIVARRAALRELARSSLGAG